MDLLFRQGEGGVGVGVKGRHLDEGVPHVQALDHAEGSGDALSSGDEGARGQTGHHILGVHLHTANTALVPLPKHSSSPSPQTQL